MIPRWTTNSMHFAKSRDILLTLFCWHKPNNQFFCSVDLLSCFSKVKCGYRVSQYTKFQSLLSASSFIHKWFRMLIAVNTPLWCASILLPGRLHSQLWLHVNEKLEHLAFDDPKPISVSVCLYAGMYTWTGQQNLLSKLGIYACFYPVIYPYVYKFRNSLTDNFLHGKSII